MRSTTSISIKVTKILDFSIKKRLGGMSYQATIEKNKNILHVIVQKYIYSVPLFRLNV